MTSCPFCKNKEIEKRTIVRNKFAFAFPTNIPIVPGHSIICPVRHRETINGLSPRELKAILGLQKRIRNALQKTFGAKGFNYAWNEGESAGQKIPHFHLHILPRKKGDTGVTRYEPRKFLYRPASREKTPEAELRAVAALIKKNLKI